MSDRLVDFLRASKRGGFGWVPKYEESSGFDKNAAGLVGWYMGMLDDLVDAIGGVDDALAIVDCHRRHRRLVNVAAGRIIADDNETKEDDR